MRGCLSAAALSVFAGLAAPAWAEKPPADPAWDIAPVPTREVEFALDSGPVTNGELAGAADMIWSADVFAEKSAWVRVRFGAVTLAGDPEAENGSYLVIRSLQDGHTQRLTAATLRQWGGVSAFFNGPIVRVELWAAPSTGANRVEVLGLSADDWAARTGPEPTMQDLCGIDDRTRSFDNRQGRIMTIGCTGWMWNDTNNQFITAGHCGPSATAVMQFNVPLSTSSGATVNPPPEDQYPIDPASVQSTNGGVGNDFAYFGVFPNSNTGQTPFQRYGEGSYALANAPAPAGVNIRITGYGTTTSPVSPTLNQAQKTHVGPMSSFSGTTVRYTTDTTGGNSGSPIINDNTGQAIGVHTHAGCTTGGNQGTASQHPTFTGYRNNPLGVTRSGRGTVGGTLFAVGDQNNNFGTLRATPNNFAKISQIGARWQGMAYDANAGRFLGIEIDRDLVSINPATGVATPLGVVTGTAQTLTGLGHDAQTNRLYAMAPTTGQLFWIDLVSLVATPVGSANGGSVRALDFDPARRVLWGVDTSGTVRLVRIDPMTGARTDVGPLGAGVSAVGDLAVDAADLAIYGVNPANGHLLRIDAGTGAATSLGTTNGVFGAALGLASSSALPSTPRPVILPPVSVSDLGGNGNANGRIDPGESAITLTIPVINSGAPAIGIVATLASLTPGVTVTDAVSAYPDLATVESGANLSPFRLAVDQSFPCGAPIGLRLSFATAAGESVSDFNLSTGTAGGLGAAQTFTFAGAAAIPDASATGVTTSVVAANVGTIADVDFRFNGTTCSSAIGATTVGLAHTYVGDLDVDLVSPAGTAVRVMSRPGGTGNGGNNFCNTVLNDDGPAASIQSISSGGAPWTGSFQPAAALSAFDGQPSGGTWQLRVFDRVGTDTGTVRNWSVVITPVTPPVCESPRPAPTCQVDFTNDGVLNQEDLSGYLTAFLREPPAPGPSGTSVSPCAGAESPFDASGYAADFNRDCTLNQEDLGGFITEYFGESEMPDGCVPG